ncbi:MULTISPECIES: glycosyltransferase family 2 protein [Bosea]|uniref:glycosyltransferase family 2 protein n=1 Tax=Bosea TaxID=85413 RepID=UPI00214FE139|nr:MULTISPECIES: glycosyltransferase family 2 protein [Bosea]MCR4523802.1 glycosyltransferase family 2 protein [Bosea sp. 47.2.35]MDR6830380.1 glycosyltransferase involved in cell wall biosynthesis [Bosea robiniae]MDR6897135.1 glycosyltransferase involved in cell wall biosynthesis [Bosea sp. BE109]MDR7140532.1 glycosyltransferase involved in cell wall biosynthesis [Bosea sp. BE168]MDR7177147.1 glycosyltransferase involved in cell wall biosynthesis [Bosea sp. BE271]
MYKGKIISVVVPCYNEGHQIHKVVETMPDFIDHIVIVDDLSKDDTVGVVKALREKHPRITLLEHAENQGVGGAIASGYKWSRDNDIDAAVVMAGDAQMDPDDLPALLDPVVNGEVDYSKGNRLIWRGSYRIIPKKRFFGNSILSFLTKIASGYWHVADSQTGYTVINKDALATIDWDTMYRRYGQPNDLLIKLNIDDFRVRDVPVRPVYGVGEISGIKIRRVVFTISNVLVRGFLKRMWEKYVVRDFHPLVLFYLLGVLMLGLFSVMMLRVIVLWIMDGFAPPMSAMAALFAFSTGLQAMFFAMWFDMDANKHLR